MKKILIILSPLIVITAGLIFHFLTNKTDEYQTRDYPQIEKDGFLSIAISPDPVNYFPSGDSIGGFNYELLNFLQSYTPVKFKITVENNLEEISKGMASGRYDIIARNIPVNSVLKQDYNFTDPVINNKFVLVQRKAEYNNGKEPIRDHLDIGGITIHTAKNSPFIPRIKNLSHEIGDTIYIVENEDYDDSQIALMAASGEIDFTVLDYRTAVKIASHISELDILTDIGFTHFESWAVRPSSTILLDSINTWLERFKKTDNYSSLLRKYYSTRK